MTQGSLAVAHTGSVIAKQGSVADKLLWRGKASWAKATTLLNWQWCGSAEAAAAVTEGSVVVRARRVRTGLCRQWCGSVKQGTVEAQGSATVGSGSGWCRTWLWLRRRQGQRSSGHGRGWERKMKGVRSKNLLPSSYRTSRVAEGSFPSNFAIISML